MARTSNNFSIFAEVRLDTSTIQKQLDNYKVSGIKVPVNLVGDGLDQIKELNKGLKQTADNVQEVDLSFNAAHEIFNKSIDILSKMTEQVFALNDSITEYRKVTNLSGDELDEYTEKLSKLGRQVARTGKP